MSQAKPHMRLDRWELVDFAPGDGAKQGAERGEGVGWIPVPAPGDTYLALVAAGRLPHPFERRHEADASWVRDREWWWRTTFEAQAGEQARLVFEGLDTFASIFLDGVLLARTDNMFRTYAFDIGPSLTHEGLHTLAIRFDPPALMVPAGNLPVWGAFKDRVSGSKRNLMRKAQFGWGWDWGPDLPTVGIWRPARLERRIGPGIASLGFTTLAATDTEARVRIMVELDGADRPSHRVEITLLDPAGHQLLTQKVTSAEATSLTVSVVNPQLWWTADLGSQPLYTLVVRLFDGVLLLDERERKVGLRTITIDTSPDPDEPGTTFFRFVLNGSPIFAKGACWVPPTSFVAEVEEDRYRRLLEQAAGANMNMIRIWGGGVYEPDLFYDLCDRLGLLVWQDFMFACAHYPEDNPRFINSVWSEVGDQVRRLRGHACLAAWCGNNENEAMHAISADITGDPAPLSGKLYYNQIIPSVLEALDPNTPYWPGSPGGGPSPNSMRGGDVHDWTVWHGVPPVPDTDPVGGFDSTPLGVAYTRYAEDMARFVSEFGIQAAPALATLKRWMDPADLHLDSPGFLDRVKDEAAKAYAMMSPVTGRPTTLEDYVDFTMWTQAEGLKFGIEHFRRRKPHCSGAVIWQLNDCWPCVSWSLVDYDGVEKASYHAVARAFAPVLASFKALGDDWVELWITNDTLAPVSGDAMVELRHLDGRPAWRQDAPFQIAANTSAPIWRGSAPEAVDKVLSVRSPEGAFAPNRHHLAPIARLALKPGARPRMTVTPIAAADYRIDLTADDYLAFVHLTSERPDLRFSDNYFDMATGEQRSLTVRANSAFGAEDFAVRCWNQRLCATDSEKDRA
jgi:beta-mannosidase